MKAERLAVFVCVLGMLLCIAFAARADEADDEPIEVSPATVVVTPTPTPTLRERAEAVGFLVPTVEEVAVCTNWFVAPMAFAYLSFPAYRALHAHSATWRNLPEDKRLHFAHTAMLGGIGSSLAFSFPTHADSSPWLWKRGAAIGTACLSAGVAKETLDEMHGSGFDPEDLAADAAGCVAGLATGAALGSFARVSAAVVVGERTIVTAQVRF